MSEKRGRRTHNTRGYAEYVGGTVMRFTCSEGHTWTEDMNRSSLPAHRRVGELGCRFYASWWSKAKGGVNLWCKACAKQGKLVR